MGNRLNLYKGLLLGEGNRAISIEKVNTENIYVRLQSDSQRRIIPTQLIVGLLPHLQSKKISIEDFNGKYRKEQGLPHLFTFLNLDYDKFILGYEATISKLCVYELNQKKDDLIHPTLAPLKIKRFYTDDWGAYERYIEPNKHEVEKRNTQKIERKNLNLRTWIKRLTRKSICFSRS